MRLSWTSCKLMLISILLASPVFAQSRSIALSPNGSAANISRLSTAGCSYALKLVNGSKSFALDFQNFTALDYAAYGKGSFEQEFTAPLNRINLAMLKSFGAFGSLGSDQFNNFVRLSTAAQASNAAELYFFNHNYISTKDAGAFVAVRFLTDDVATRPDTWGVGYAYLSAVSMSIEQSCLSASPTPTPVL